MQSEEVPLFLIVSIFGFTADNPAILEDAEFVQFKEYFASVPSTVDVKHVTLVTEEGQKVGKVYWVGATAKAAELSLCPNGLSSKPNMKVYAIFWGSKLLTLVPTNPTGWDNYEEAFGKHARLLRSMCRAEWVRRACDAISRWVGS